MSIPVASVPSHAWEYNDGSGRCRCAVPLSYRRRPAVGRGRAVGWRDAGLAVHRSGPPAAVGGPAAPRAGRPARAVASPGLARRDRLHQRRCRRGGPGRRAGGPGRRRRAADRRAWPARPGLAVAGPRGHRDQRSAAARLAVRDRGWSPTPFPGTAGCRCSPASRWSRRWPGWPNWTRALKWPNDLLVDDAKCAGILAEAVPAADPGPAARDRSRHRPQRHAACRRVAGESDRDWRRPRCGWPVRRPPTGTRCCGPCCVRWPTGMAAGGRSTGMPKHVGCAPPISICGTIGREVRVLLPTALVGEATSVNADGQLVVRAADGEHRVTAGDILHLR